jgi:hypothetical protein
MSRYTRGSGWGTIEVPALEDSGDVRHPSPFSIDLSVSASGDALVVWSGGFDGAGPYYVGAERFAPGTGWSGKEMLAENVIGRNGVSPSFGTIGDDGAAVATWNQIDPSDQSEHVVARNFSTTWSSPVNLDGTTGSGGYTETEPVTDSRGTFMAVWTERDPVGDQAYASRLTPGGSWSAKVLLNTPRTADANLTQLFPQIAMGPTGDAVARTTEWDRKANTYTVDATSFSPSDGWTPPTRLDVTGTGYATPLIDACGNASVFWLRSPSNEIMTARRVHGGSWTSPALLGKTAPSSANASFLSVGVGSNGETIASFRSEDDHGTVARVFR